MKSDDPTDKRATSRDKPGSRLELSTWILLGLIAGIACGLFFGELLRTAGDHRRCVRRTASDDGAALHRGVADCEPGPIDVGGIETIGLDRRADSCSSCGLPRC